jgi:hypothetical protein
MRVSQLAGKNSGLDLVLKGRGFSRAVSAIHTIGFQRLRKTPECVNHRGRAALQGRVSPAKSARALAPAGTPEDVCPAHIKCHPERSSRFAKRSSYVVEEPALSEAEGTPIRPALPAKHQGILPVAPVCAAPTVVAVLHGKKNIRPIFKRSR